MYDTILGLYYWGKSKNPLEAKIPKRGKEKSRKDEDWKPLNWGIQEAREKVERLEELLNVNSSIFFYL